MKNIKLKGLPNAITAGTYGMGLTTDSITQRRGSPTNLTTELRTAHLKSFINEYYNLKVDQVSSPTDRQTSVRTHTAPNYSILSNKTPPIPFIEKVVLEKASGIQKAPGTAQSGPVSSPRKRVRIMIKTS